jgi:hypothetical protein
MSLIKDFGGITISVIALAVSTASFYMNFRTVDDFRYLVAHDLLLIEPRDEYFVARAGPTALTFANAGNRQVVVLEGVMLFEQLAKPEFRECDKNTATKVKLKFEPFVVRAGDIHVQPMTFDLNDFEKPTVYKINVDVSDKNVPKVLLCVAFSMATPTRYVFDRVLMLNMIEWPRNGTNRKMDPAYWRPAQFFRLL